MIDSPDHSKKMNVTIDIPQDILDSARIKVPEIKRELLVARQIPIHYDGSDLEDEIASLKKLERL